MPKFRPNVAIVLERKDGRILVCERSDVVGAWQFPQGGVRSAESLESALAREVQEEISLSPEDYAIIRQYGPYRYLFPAGRKKDGCDGQEQTYFLARFLGKDAQILSSPETHEFRAAMWVRPSEFQLNWVAPMKRTVYRELFRDLFGVELKEAQPEDLVS